MENNLLNNEVLVNEIASIITDARNNVIKNISIELINAYWNIGRIMVEDELKSKRGEYGKNNYLHYRKLLQINLEKDFLEQIFKI
ncbi:DUF1016 N-terminal domain-containing protein [Thomasclavelia cocleata]|uniref:DUF1016 N-terminal domain-containing protein n=1 Tax=Thomasclavelia cocleata TaxID=69824 RepID=UPI00242E673C|nr:hypothetical protein [Thomasclavelia cocleata]